MAAVTAIFLVNPLFSCKLLCLANYLEVEVFYFRSNRTVTCLSSLLILTVDMVHAVLMRIWRPFSVCPADVCWC